MALTCPDCGNSKSFQVKTIEIRTLTVEESGSVSSEPVLAPDLLEMLCDACESETAVDLNTLDADQRRKILREFGIA